MNVEMERAMSELVLHFRISRREGMEDSKHTYKDIIKM
jgi:hypothetical protein